MDDTTQAAADPMQAAQSMQNGSTQDSESGGFVVCIAMQDDGTFQIYSQDSDDDQDDQSSQGESQSSGDQDEGTQTADNIDDALMMAKQMIQQEMSEEGGEDQSDGNAPLGADDAKSVWNQMAAKKDKTRAMGM